MIGQHMETLSPRKESMPKIDLHLVGTDTKKKIMSGPSTFYITCYGGKCLETFFLMYYQQIALENKMMPSSYCITVSSLHTWISYYTLLCRYY